MIMKKFFCCLIIVFNLLMPSAVIADPVPREPVVDARSAELLNRLHQIKEMDLSSLSREEKRNLRKEVKSIRKEMKAANNGIYLSFGAIIIILLLLILIFK